MNQPFNRRKIREMTLQILFSMNFNANLSLENAIQDLLTFETSPELHDEGIEVPAYLELLVSGVIANQEELDTRITKHLAKKWTLQRIPKIDCLILRIAVFEICYLDETNIPDVAAINEAVELAKSFGDESSSKFVNGVLSAVLKEKSSVNHSPL